ncbi:MAG: HelD family protein [Micavibrio sp.]
MKQGEKEEQECLNECLKAIDTNLHVLKTRLGEYAKAIQNVHDYMWDARRDMDHLEKIAVRETVDQKMRSAEVLNQQQKKLLKLKKSPYFGRFDFKRDREGTAQADAIYVGIHDFYDETNNKTIVHDWRAPVSSMFYDYEIGPARYEAPSGIVNGALERKRQFRIRDSRMEMMIESALHIVDDVLQEELSRSSDDEGMRNIVATIQRDQNAIIRDADAHTLIIQGVAGSGKTSIALHRIAFLLYRFKDTLSSKDILIISPNRVFADYIGNVLPELGEEQVNEIGMDTLADELLEGKYRFQTFFEQTALLLDKNDEELKARIVAKASLDFLKQVDAYADHLEKISFTPTEWRLRRGLIVPNWFFAETWNKHSGMPFKERIVRVVETAEHKIGQFYNHDLDTEQRRSLREAVRSMIKQTTLRNAYKNMFEWIGEPKLFKLTAGKLEYADVFPLIYLKMRLEGVDNSRKDVKHLLVDEMQDYTPMQYAVLGRLFSCRKTILGDATQSVNPYSTSNAEQIRGVLKASPPVKLTKSYRSTWEIMQFALGISPNAELVPMKRHGKKPQVIVCQKQAEATTHIAQEIRDFEASDHEALAIIAKTQKEAKRLHKLLADAGIKSRLLDADSVGFSGRVIVCTAHMAKGLEFDRVIVPDASIENYHTDMDRNLLYVACTRAMHRLTLVAVGKPAQFLPP